MFCNHCGVENPDGSKFCHSCGSILHDNKKIITNKVITEQAKSIDQEISFYSDTKGVRITNTRAIFGNKTYVMTNISSISIGKKDPNWLPVIILGLLGLLFLIISASFGILILLITCVVFYFTKGEYSVHITSASGETNAISDTNKEYIQNIVNAMNQAIIKRG